MGTKVHSALIMVVYLGMACCLTGLLSTAQIENFPHEIFGITFFVLVVCHVILNRSWVRHAFSGMWSARRIVMTVVICALALCTIMQGVNCILLSDFFWSLLPQDFAFFAASFHMAVGTWFFVFAAIHFGLNANALIGNKLRFRPTECEPPLKGGRKARVAILWVVIAAISVYGVFIFFDFQMPQYMFMVGSEQVESGIPLVVRFMQYLYVGVAIASITHCISAITQNHAHAAKPQAKPEAK